MGAVPFWKTLLGHTCLLVFVCVHACACIKCVPELYMSRRVNILWQANRLCVMLPHLLCFPPSFVDKACLYNAHQAKNGPMNCVHLRRLQKQTFKNEDRGVIQK